MQELEIDEFKLLKTQDIAQNLGIAESTVRKYCQLLADQGYQFRRDETGARIYTDHDQVALLELMKLRKEGKVGLDVACEIVATRRKSRKGTVNVNKENVAPTQNVQPLENKGFENDSKDLMVQNITELTHEIRYMKDNFVTKEQVNYLVQLVEDLSKQQYSQPPKADRREEQYKIMVADKRVKYRLETKAVELWNEQDESKRFKKRLFFFKEEDEKAKEEFIRKHVEQNYSNELAKELGLDGDESS